MAKQPSVISLNALQQDATATFKRVRKSKRPLIVTRRGKPAAILLSVSAYKRSEEEREILKLLALGEREIAAGTGFDLDEVLAQADNLLANA
jgi:prevent-host-death family protein